MIQRPQNFPTVGDYYYHFKHDPKKSVNNYAYIIVGVGRHSEDDCDPEEKFMVSYRPLYINDHIEGADFFNRPLESFLGTVTKEGVTRPRFTKITDRRILEDLWDVKVRMGITS